MSKITKSPANSNRPAPFQRMSPPRILAHPANPQGSSPIYRISAPANALNRLGFATVITDFRRPAGDTLKVLNPDVVIDQTPYTAEHFTSLQNYKKAGKYIVVDIDDLFWDVADDNPNKASIPADVKQKMQRCFALADRVTASTAYLADRVHEDLNVPRSKITILRNALPQAFITAAKSAKRAPRSSEKPRIGWTGSISHASDLAILAEVVKRTSDKYQWVFLGSAPEGVEALIEFHSAVSFSQFPGMLGSLDLDLGVVPLANTNFNKSKSDLKVLEYAAAGYPVLTSRLSTFKDRPGLPNVIQEAIDNDADSWILAIEDYFNSGKMQEHAQVLTDWVKRHGILESLENINALAKAWTPEGQYSFVPNRYECNGDIAIVGEPIGTPHFKTIKEAREAMPEASVLYVRPGATPSDAQIERMLSRLSGTNESEDSGSLKIFASVSALSNDGDYPTPGKFTRLENKVAQYMALAALTLEQQPSIPVPYSSSPVVLLSAKALSLVGIPDEKRYSGDIETALIEWSLRVNNVTGIVAHVVAPDVFVPVQGAAQRNPNDTRMHIAEISTWHPNFPQLQKQAAEEDNFSSTRKSLDMAYVYASYAAPQASDYPSWLSMHDSWTPAVQAWADKEMLNWSEKPNVLVVMPAYNPDPAQFTAAIESVKAQTYPHWRLVIVDDASTDGTTFQIGKDMSESDKARITFVHRKENGHISKASNDALKHIHKDDKWVLFLDHDDLLSPNALHMLVREVVANPELKMVYGDSDLIAPDGVYHSPDFKPGFDYDLLLAQNYICHPCMYLAHTVKELGGFRVGFEGSQDYDLALRYLDHYGIRNGGAGHVAQILYHWRQSVGSVASDIQNKPYALEAANKAVLEHLNRRSAAAFLGPHPIAPMHHMVRFLPPNPAPQASILILTQTDRTQIEKCVSSILANTAYPNYQVIIRQVGSDAGVSEACTRFARADKRVKHIKGGGDVEGTFNFALLNNALAKSPLVKDSEVLVFLNDDTVILEGAWLNDMVGAALREEVGAVGAKLIYPDGTIQHGGVIIDPTAPPGEIAIHAYQKQPHNSFGAVGRAVIARQSIAVTGACLAIRHDVFDSVGGFDAANFPLDYNDIDLCLRLADKGLVNVVLQHIVVQHTEGATKATRPDIMSRTAMLMSESALEETPAYQSLLAKGELTRYSNANLAHEPSGQMLRNNPYRPWHDKNPLPISLLIGGDKEDTQRLYTDGELPIVVDVDGPYMRFIEPPMPQVGVVDIRDKAAMEEVLSGLGITRIVMRRLGKGSIELLGLLRILAMDNWPVFYVASDFESVCPRLTCINSLGACNHEWKNGVDNCQTCIDRDGSENHGYISVASYRNAWSMLSTAITPPLNTAQEV